VQPNAITYNTVLNAFAQGGAMNRVPALLEDMKAASPPVEPDIVTYSTIVKGFCTSGCLDRALEILQEVNSSDKFAPDEVMYNSILDGCTREQRPDDALKILGDMRKSGVLPSNYTLSMLVKLMGRCRRLNQAFSLIEEISQEYGLKVNIQVYTCLIQACFNNRQANKAVTLHDQIIKQGLLPDDMTYRVLVKGCLDAGLVDTAVYLVKFAYGIGRPKSKDMPPGVDDQCLAELMSALGGPGSKDAKELQAELGQCKTAAPRRGGPQFKGKGKGKGK
jgi:pentatricopeptide repeat protein